MTAGRLRQLRSSLCAAAAILASAAVPGAVVIHEIHYRPSEGSILEFVELFNTGDATVRLGGWSLGGAVHYVLPQEARLAPGGFIVVASNREVLSERFGLPPEGVFGDFTGSLDNGGETLILADANGAHADEVRYDDDPPWDADADGLGPSLERVCASSDSGLAANWEAMPGRGPTPLGPNPAARCPPGPIEPLRVAITEIHYHPPGDDPREELVELMNVSPTALNLKGYAFSAGIDFRFVEDRILEPAARIAVCRDAVYIRATYAVQNAVGDFSGRLSNDGERVTLIDERGEIADSVRYDDNGDWPVAADRFGRSLEKRAPTAPSDDPGSWAASGPPDPPTRVHVDIAGAATSTQLHVTLHGRGEFLLDNVVLTDPESPAQNRIQNSTFGRGIDSWLMQGTHWYSAWDPTGGNGASGAFRVAAHGRNPGDVPGKEAALQEPSSVFTDASPPLVQGRTYRLSFDIELERGLEDITVALAGSTAGQGLFWRSSLRSVFTPGAVNSVESSHLPPSVSAVSRFPLEPASSDPVWVSARVRSSSALRRVTLYHELDGQPAGSTVDLLDDGQHRDGAAGDGIHGGLLRTFKHNSVVTFRVQAEDLDGAIGQSPPTTDPTGYHAFYVNDLKPSSPLPVYQLLLRHTLPVSPRDTINSLNCQSYWTGAFAFRGDVHPGGIRMRGASVCMTRKPYLKLRFARGREFQGQSKLNLQALWTDKSLVREKLSFDLFQELGLPCSDESYVRVHANGRYYGLYGALEQMDERFLEREGLDPDGNLYKSVGSGEDMLPDGIDYDGPFTKETNEDGDFSDLAAFIKDMHLTPPAQLASFFKARTDEDRLIEYQLVQILANNIDYTVHNHYLYHDLERDKWLALPWDMDLTFGKASVFGDDEYSPGISPWFGTSKEGELSSQLLDKLFTGPGDWYQRAYLVRLWDHLQEKFTQGFYGERLAQYRQLLFQEQLEDIAAWGRLTDEIGGNFPRDFDSNLERVRIHVQARRTFLLRTIESRSPPNVWAHDRLKITEVLYHPAAGEEDLEFLELWNPGEKEVGLAAWSIDGIGFLFPARAKAAPGEVFIVARDPGAFARRYGPVAAVYGPYEGKLDNSGEVLRLRDAGPKFPATVDFLRYGVGDGWPREAEGLGHSIELTEVSPWRDNDLAVYWRASAEPGGSPGRIDGITPENGFSRGDPTADGRANITDALAIVGYLFLGGGEPPCREAADVDADGRVDLTDALVLLRHLFQGAGQVIPFPAPGECAPAAVETCRVSSCAET